VLARMLGMGSDGRKAARRVIALNGATRAIDLGYVDGRPFAFSAGVGLDAAVVRLVDQDQARKHRFRWGAFWMEAVRVARLAREMGCGDFVKIEVIRDTKYLLPDNAETLKATEILAKEGFVVLPYMYPDLNAARDMAQAGAAAIMPLGAPIGSNKGLSTKEFIQILIDEIDLPIIIDAGIGRPSQACEAMEMGAAGIMANTAIASAGDIPAMATAFRQAIEAGRTAYLAGLGPIQEIGAAASSPLIGFLRD